MRAVLDPNTLIVALLSPRSAPGQLLARWLAGDFELVVSRQLLEELERALGYPKLRGRIDAQQAAGFISLLSRGAVVVDDPPVATRRSADPGDDYLFALAEGQRAVLVSGDRHVLALEHELPVRSARAFLEAL